MGALHEGHLNLGMPFLQALIQQSLMTSPDESLKTPFDGNDTLRKSNASMSTTLQIKYLPDESSHQQKIYQNTLEH